MAGLFKKPCYVSMSCRNHLILQNSNTASWFKIQVDPLLIKQPVVLKKWMKSLGKQGYIYTFSFITKKVTAQTWPNRVSDY